MALTGERARKVTESNFKKYKELNGKITHVFFKEMAAGLSANQERAFNRQFQITTKAHSDKNTNVIIVNKQIEIVMIPEIRKLTSRK